jgi:hypothetical protein
MNGELRIVHWPIILEDKKESIAMNVEVEITQIATSMNQTKVETV